MKPKPSPLLEDRVNTAASPASKQTPRARRRRSRVVLNVRLLVGSALFLVVLIPSAVFWHAFQARCNRDLFLSQATAAEQKEQWGEAAKYLYRYLQLEPNPEEVIAAHIRLAIATDQGAKTPRAKARAAQLYYKAIGLTDDSEDLRKRLGILLVESRQFQAAIRLYPEDSILTPGTNPAHAAGKAIHAIAKYLLARSVGDKLSGEVNVELQAIADHPPGDITLARLFSLICLDLQQPGSAWLGFSDTVVDHMVEANSEDAVAYLTRYNYLRRRSPIGIQAQKAADLDLDKAIALAPDDLEVLLAAGQRALVNEEFPEARHYFEKVVEQTPDEGRGYLMLGQAYAFQENTDEAVRAWKQGIDQINPQDPNSLNAHFTLGRHLFGALFSLNRADEVADILTPLRQRVEGSHFLGSSAQANLLTTLDLYRAQREAVLGHFRDAVLLLQKVRVARQRPVTRDEATERLQALSTLGSCYTQLGQFDLAVRVYDEAESAYAQLAASGAATGDTDKQAAEEARRIQAVRMRVGYQAVSGDALHRSGRYDDAIRSYERALNTLSRDPSATLQDTGPLLAKLAFAHYRRQVNLPPKDRDWEPFREEEGAFAKAKQAYKNRQDDPVALQLTLLEILSYAAQDNTEKALGLLNETEEAYPDSPAVWRAVVAGHQAWGLPGDADRKLEQFVERTENANLAVMLRVELLSRRRQWDKARELLTRELKPKTEQEQIARELQLAKLDLMVQDPESAKKRFENLVDNQASQLNPGQLLSLVRVLAETALAAPQSDPKEVRNRIEQLKSLEGEETGTWWRYFEAMRLLAGSTETSATSLSEAEDYQRQIETLRPKWPKGYTLKAEIAVKRRKLDEAIEFCQNALRFGDRTLSTYQRLIELLTRQRRYSEIDAYFEQMGNLVLYSQGLSNLAIQRSLQVAFEKSASGLQDDAILNSVDQNVEFQHALQLARSNARQRPEDLLAKLWLGYTLMLAKQDEEAKEVYESAVEIAPQSVLSWAALFNFYFKTERSDEGTKVLKKLQTVSLSEEDEKSRSYVLGQCYEKIGDLDKAARHYREAIEQSPKNERVLDWTSRFFLRTDPEVGEKLLRRLGDLSDNPSPSRRKLALHLATRGGKQNWQEALTIIDALLDQLRSEADVAINHRIKAMILLRRYTSENRQQAIESLEVVVRNPAAAPTDRLRLAALYEQQSIYAKASDLIRKVETNPDLRPEHLAAVVDFYLRNSEEKRADDALVSLEQRGTTTVTTVQLRARLLEKTGQTEQIPSLIEQYVDGRLDELQDARRQVELLLAMANLSASLDLQDTAEAYYRRAAEIDPPSSRYLAIWLAKRGNTHDALQLALSQHHAEPSPVTMSTVLSLLTIGNPTEKDFQLVEPLIAEEVEQYQDNAAVLTSLATLRYKQQRMDESLEFYRRALEIDENNVVALNNAAWMLAEQGTQADQALAYIEHAIDFHGPNLQLLDTRGMVLLFQRNAARAVEDLARVVGEKGAEAQHQFHYALALVETGKIDEARRWLEEARGKGLSRDQLTPVERNMLDELEKALGT